MTLTRTDQILQVLFPEKGQSTHSIWMILDGARDDRIYNFLRTCNLDYACLYSGNLPIELRYVAPYLLELPYNSKTARELIDLAWGNSWGVFLSIEDMSKLRPHLRKFLKVKDESGNKLIFRYYDPRVLRVFLPICTNEQLKEIFGPIESYWTEGENEEGMLEYRLDGISLAHSFIMLNGK